MNAYSRHIATGLVTGSAAVASSFAVMGSTPEYVVAPIAATVVALTPDAVVTASILILGSLGSKLGFLLAHAIAVGLFGAIAIVFAWLGPRYDRGPTSEVIVILGGAAATGVLGLVLVNSWPSALAAAFGLSISHWAVRHLIVEPSSVPGQQRRRFIGGFAALAGFAGIAFWTGRQRGESQRLPGEGVFGTETEPGVVDRAPIDAKLQEAREASFEMDGLDPLVSDIGDFYEVDINSINPTVDAETWSLQVSGAVERPMEVTYDDLLAGEVEHRFVTLRCVGESLNGRKMDTAIWTGVPVRSILDRAGATGDRVMLRAADQYFEEFPLEALEDGFLAFGMNGEVLPRGHGHPVRALVPGHWGEINVKWLNRIEVLDEQQDGYWEQRGWHGTGPVNTVTKLWTVNNLPDGRIEVGGHAYAGTRGIASVEVSADGGGTWTEADLGPELPGIDVWRQWRHVIGPLQEDVTVVVRATDGTGDLQPEAESQPYPSGATGWVSKTIGPE